MSTTMPNAKQAAMLLEEITMTVLTIDRLCYHIPVGETDADALETQIDVIRGMVNRVGWMADLGHKALTGKACAKGDAEQWLMSPAYLATLKQASTTGSVEVAHG